MLQIAYVKVYKTIYFQGPFSHCPGGSSAVATVKQMWSSAYVKVSFTGPISNNYFLTTVVQQQCRVVKYDIMPIWIMHGEYNNSL